MIGTEDFEGEYYDNSLADYNTYEEYLDSFVSDLDRQYLADQDLARQLYELGIHSKTQILTKEHFDEKKKAVEEAKRNQNKDKVRSLTYPLVKDPQVYLNDPFLKALADREDQVLNGRLMVIIFIRAEVQKSGTTMETSGYIDYAHRLKTENFKPYFEKEKQLLPKGNDLSYYNWNTGVCVSNDSPNFKVDASNGNAGLLFRNKRDRKVINVDPMKKTQDNTTRLEVTSTTPCYKQIVIFDHYTRRKTN